MTDNERIVITGMSVNTPLGDTLDGFIGQLFSGRSAISRWEAFDTDTLLPKIGGDLSKYDIAGKVEALGKSLPDFHERLRRVGKKAPWSTRLALLLALDAWRDGSLGTVSGDPFRTVVFAGGHGFGSRYGYECGKQFHDDPDYMDALYSLQISDPDIPARISEVLGTRGMICTVGGACASGALALRPAFHELRHGGAERAVVVAPVLDFSPMDYQGMALLGAVSVASFNDTPERASRPWDIRREGFVPAHGGAAIVLESLATARARGARIHAELVSVAATSDANHLPEPSEEGQAAAIAAALREGGISAGEIDYISAHATSTPRGDVTEIRSIKHALGKDAARVKLNATKSMTGHTLWSAPLLELVAGVLQMQAGRLHGTINIEQLDSEVDLDVCANGPVNHEVRCFLKNSFGFGGINCVSLLRRYDG